ncbi:MAG: M61 family peptidase [Sulfolobaceae archaeon]|nr:M61 family peptidase [Sulfolobaceae archaeon]
MFFLVKPKNRYLEIFAEGRSEGIITFPTYVPGSYVIRDLERHIVEIDGERLTKNKFRVKKRFRYLIYTASKDQREAISTNDYLFINPPAVFPFMDVYEEYCVKIDTQWRIMTSLRRVEDPQRGEVYCADNYHEFADSPIEASPFLREIQIDETHSISTIDDIDVEMLKKIVEEADKIIQPPKDRKYIFHFRRSDKNFGGIEHRYSSAIVVNWSRKDLATLFAHEYFHRLNVKELVPKDLKHNYENEVYTDLLWFAEGFTDYMALLITLRAKLIKPEEGLKTVLSALHDLTFPGAKRTSLAEASRIAWIKLYKRDENFLNSSVSYYEGGLALAFYLDSKLIRHGRRIDDVFSSLRNIKEYTFEDLDKIAKSLGFHELDLAYKPSYEIFKAIKDDLGIEVTDEGKPYYGLIIEGNTVKFIEDGSPADIAGLMPEDQIVAVDGVNRSLEVRDSVTLEIIREGRLKMIKLTAGKSPGHSLKVKIEGEIAEKVFGKSSVEGKYNTNVI